MTAQTRAQLNETLELLTSYETQSKILGLVAEYLNQNRSVANVNALGAGLAVLLEAEYGSVEMAAKMNNTPSRVTPTQDGAATNAMVRGLRGAE